MSVELFAETETSAAQREAAARLLLLTRESAAAMGCAPHQIRQVSLSLAVQVVFNTAHNELQDENLGEDAFAEAFADLWLALGVGTGNLAVRLDEGLSQAAIRLVGDGMANAIAAMRNIHQTQGQG